MINKFKIRKLKLSIGVVLLFTFYVLGFRFAPTAHAQTQKGITVSPSIIHIDLATDQPKYELTYTNNTNTNINLVLSVQDFSELEANYQLNFLSQKDAANYKYSLASWISFENNNLQLNPGEIKTVTVFINKDRITKGGHYASILAQVQQAQNKSAINILPTLSSLLFVRASTGQEIEQGEINDFMPLRDGIEFPETFITMFQNSGNVHVVPHGLIQIYDPLGNLVAKGTFNINSLDALPESIRRFDTNIDLYQKVLLPGIYTAKINLHFGNTDKTISASVKFFSQGMFDFIKIALGIIIISLLGLYLRKKLKTKSS
jgi:hypothetical protein